MTRINRITLYLTLAVHLCFAAFILAPWIDAASSGVVTSLYGGTGGAIPYQSAANTTAFLTNGSAGQVLTSAGTTLPPTWAAATGGVTGNGTATVCPRWAAGSPSTTLEDSPAQCQDRLFQYSVSSALGGRVLLGDLSNLSNHVKFDLNDSSDSATITLNPNPAATSGAIVLNSAAGSTTIGDTLGALHNTTIGVNDFTKTINVNSPLGTTSIGDVASAGNSTEVQVNDSARTITLGTTNGQINLTGKASADMLWTPTVPLVDNGTTVATNAASSNSFRVLALTANVTLSNPTNPNNGQRIVWEVIQNAGAAKTLAFDTQFGFGAEITGCTISATLSSHNFVTAVYNSTATKWYVVGCVTGY